MENKKEIPILSSYKLENVLSLKSKYSIRLYEILKSHQFKNIVTIRVEELKSMLGIKESLYNDFRNFEKRVLKGSKKEIGEKTDIKFEFEKIKDGRKITALKFYITKNAQDNRGSENQINVNDLDVNSAPDNLLSKINKTLGINFGLKAFKLIMATKGEEEIEHYLTNWHKFDCTAKRSIAGFFFAAVMKGYEIPQTQGYKPPQATNYQQRQYDDNYFESLYDNFS